MRRAAADSDDSRSRFSVLACSIGTAVILCSIWLYVHSRINLPSDSVRVLGDPNSLRTILAREHDAVSSRIPGDYWIGSVELQSLLPRFSEEDVRESLAHCKSRQWTSAEAHNELVYIAMVVAVRSVDTHLAKRMTEFRRSGAGPDPGPEFLARVHEESLRMFRERAAAGVLPLSREGASPSIPGSIPSAPRPADK